MDEEKGVGAVVPNHRDEFYMRVALEEAQEARKGGEIPIGAVLVLDGTILARDHNRKEELRDASAHAEILVIRSAGQKVGSWRLESARLYVTAEPCLMCWGAILEARIPYVAYGGASSQVGRMVDTQLLYQNGLARRVQIVSGILKQEAASLLRSFFQEAR